jgi:hypothetical protein
MRKGAMLLVMVGFIWGCNDSATVQTKVDSLSKKIDSTGKRLWDSGKKDLKKLKDTIQNKFQNQVAL